MFTVSSVVVDVLPIDPKGPNPRDFPQATQTGRAEPYFHHHWAGLALELTCAFLAPVAEELVFRGWLLPRSRAACVVEPGTYPDGWPAAGDEALRAQVVDVGRGHDRDLVIGLTTRGAADGARVLIDCIREDGARARL